MNNKTIQMTLYLPVLELLIILTMLSSIFVPFVVTTGEYQTVKDNNGTTVFISADVEMGLNSFFGFKRGVVNETDGINAKSEKVDQLISPYSEVFFFLSTMIIIGLIAESFRLLDKRRRIEKNPSLFMIVKLSFTVSVILILFQLWVINSNIDSFNSGDTVGVVFYSDKKMELTTNLSYFIYQLLLSLLLIRNLILRRLIKSN